MTFSQFINSLYATVGVGESMVKFFKTFFKEITSDEITDDSFPKDDAIRKYCRGERSPRIFFQEVKSIIDNDALEDYLSDIFYEDNAEIRFMAYCKENNIQFDAEEEDLPCTLTKEFENIVNHVMYSNDDKEKIKIKSILDKINLLWGFMYSTGIEISKISRSPYHPFIVNSKIYEPRKKLNNFLDSFKELNEKLIPYL